MTEEPKQEDSDVQGTEENYRWGKIARYVFDNLTSTLTLLYIYVTAIGMLYSSVLYGKSGINIFDYSEVGDFLLAAFKIPTVLFAIVLAAPLVFGWLFIVRMIQVLWQTIRRRSESEREGFYEGWVSTFLEAYHLRSIVLANVISTFIFTAIYPALTASDIKDGEKTTVEVRYRSFSSSVGQVTVPGLEFIGATQRASFFYDADEKRTIVIPQSQIVSIEVPEQD